MYSVIIIVHHVYKILIHPTGLHVACDIIMKMKNRGVTSDVSDKYVKLKASKPDRSGGEEVDRGGVLEKDACENGNNYTGVEIVQEDLEVSTDGEIQVEETLSLKTLKETEN